MSDRGDRPDDKPYEDRPYEDPDEGARGQRKRGARAWIRRHRRALGWTHLLLGVAFAFAAADFVVEYAIAQVPMPEEVELSSSSQVFDRNGRLIATYRGEITRFIIDTRELPDHVTQAVIAAEDRDFYQHEGLSIGGLARAAWENFSSGEVRQGGSTITQQYVKNAVLQDSSRTVERKVKEAVLAIKIERTYSKDEILDMYLNTVYFGRGAYGIQAAARAYFAKDAKELTISESSYLAGLIPAPARWQPRKDSDNAEALARRDYVLRAMESEGYITAAEAAEASDSKLRFKSTRDLNRRRIRAAYFLEWLRKDYLYPRYGECLYTCGLKIHTTLDLQMQREAEQAVASQLTEPEHPQASLVSMTPDGEVRAFVGGRDFMNVKTARGYNYASDGVRQAGSSFKPFTLLAAIDQGISTSSYISGESPKTIEDPACAGPDGVWEPENYGGSSYGSMDLNTATHNSVNTVYAELISEIGPQSVADLLEEFGFTSPDGSAEIPPLCSLSLGTLDVSVLHMTRAYAGLAARGALPEITPISYVTNQAEECLLGFGTPKKMECEERINTKPHQAVEENSADVLTQTLRGVIESGTATGAYIGRPAAGKTGTTQDNRDAWFAGYTPQLATVVWMGYPIEKGPDKKFGTADDYSPLMQYCYESADKCRPVNGINVTGGSFPAAIWQAFMAAALEGTDILDFTYPAYEGTIVLNPPPPPTPETEDTSEEDSDPQGQGPDGEGPPGQEEEDD